ncbi:MAG TPA: hypothetical protein VGP33_12405 [Chloroflexota bacterium]|nr:hypothetical protein [Chloroflexota bacterium]
MSAVASTDMGKASGATNTLQRFGGVFGIAVATAAFSANGHLGTAAIFDAGLRPALVMATGLAVLDVSSAPAIGHRRAAATRPRAAVPAASYPATPSVLISTVDSSGPVC